jgi:hypothetical protein
MTLWKYSVVLALGQSFNFYYNWLSQFVVGQIACRTVSWFKKKKDYLNMPA